MLLTPVVSSRVSVPSTYTPTFTDNLNFTDAVITSCSNILSCMIDATLTGINQIGNFSSNNVQTQRKDIKILSKTLSS